MKNIEYKVNAPVSVEQFVGLLNASSLGERRPVDDLQCMQGMLDHANLTVSAWLEGKLIGFARSVTDFHYACYLSDLAVDLTIQKQGVGKQLQRLTQEALGPQCKLILLAAPAANAYYAPLGYQHNPRCWVLEPEAQIEA
ncbi:MAG: GNAT family N-acetyltransferase [Oleiphilus sp.]